MNLPETWETDKYNDKACEPCEVKIYISLWCEIFKTSEICESISFSDKNVMQNLVKWILYQTIC